MLRGMKDQAGADAIGEEDASDGLVPYAVDFTPAMLGGKLGEDQVLPWLLEQANASVDKGTFMTLVMKACFYKVKDEKSRRDMASHVLQGLQNYLLVFVTDEGYVTRTRAGDEILEADPASRDVVFARHILTRCNGFRLIEAIQRFEIRGERPSQELLNDELDRNATSKSLSTMKAWLQRAGVMKPGKPYAIDDRGIEHVMGTSPRKLIGLDRAQVEFLLAARVIAAQQTGEVLEAADVRICAEIRAPDVRIPGKMLGKFVRDLVGRGLLVDAGKVRSKGGSRVAFTLSDEGLALSDEQIRAFVLQSSAGYLLSDLKKLDELLADLAGDHAEHAGRIGEMLAVHVCLMMGLRVVGWRERAPSEIDLTAERVVALTYQRWHVQVKNTITSLDIDQVDREIGVAAGTGATHLLFVVPRGAVTAPARAEIRAKNMLTHLHIFVLNQDAFEGPVKTARVLSMIKDQQDVLARWKRGEAERRERA
jgi:hypothetical protein